MISEADFDKWFADHTKDWTPLARKLHGAYRQFYLRGYLAGARESALEVVDKCALLAEDHECGGEDDIVCQHQNCSQIIAGHILALRTRLQRDGEGGG